MDASMLNRREALSGLAGAAALFGITAESIAADTGVRDLPTQALLRRDPETYWNRLREEQFLMPGKRAFLNTYTSV